MDSRPMQIEGVVVKEDEELTSYSTMRLKAKGTVWIVSHLKALQELVVWANREMISYRVIGKGSNQLFKENSPIPYLLLNFAWDKATLFGDKVQEEYRLPANVPIQNLTAEAIRLGLKGWEVFSGIPGQVGGTVFMNGGTGLGEIGELVKEVSLVTVSGEIRKVMIDNPASFFNYRKNLFVQPGEVIFEVVLTHKGVDPQVADTIRHYLKKRAMEQPLTAATCGCVFKNCQNGPRAGQVIDQLGFKGFRHHHFQVSPKHANFIENLGGGTYQELLELIHIIQKKVKEKTGFELELEVKID